MAIKAHESVRNSEWIKNTVSSFIKCRLLILDVIMANLSNIYYNKTEFPTFME